MAWKLVFCIILYICYYMFFYFLSIAGQRAKEALRSVQPPCFLAGVPELMEILKCQEQSCLQVPQDGAKTFASPMAAGRNQRQTALCSKVILSWSSTKMREGPCNCLLMPVDACWGSISNELSASQQLLGGAVTMCWKMRVKTGRQDAPATSETCHQRKPPFNSFTSTVRYSEQM